MVAVAMIGGEIVGSERLRLPAAPALGLTRQALEGVRRTPAWAVGSAPCRERLTGGGLTVGGRTAVTHAKGAAESASQQRARRRT